MGTQQALTTNQLELLTIIYDIEEFGKKHGNETDIQEILVQNDLISEEEFEEISEVLIYYGYLSEDREVTIDGKQYINLFVEYLQEKEKHPDVVINNSFSLIDFENLNIKLSAFEGFTEVGEMFKTVANRVKKVRQAIENKMQ